MKASRVGMEEHVKMMSTLTIVNVRLVTLATCARPVSRQYSVDLIMFYSYISNIYTCFPLRKHTNISCYPNYSRTIKVIKQTSRDIAITYCNINTIYLCTNSIYANHTCSTYSNHLLYNHVALRL